VDSRTSVTDIKFAPKSLGLLLATCSADGVVRIYEAPDVMNLSQWTLQHEVSCKLPCSCLSWNPSFSRSEQVLYESTWFMHQISFHYVIEKLKFWC
jgi:WD40 repeat protein